jgi:tryptophanyl-tRNA synthetase
VLVARFAGAGYGDLKQEVAAAYLAMVEPFQARVRELLEGSRLDEILAAGAARAQAQAAGVLDRVYDRVGFLPGRR